MSDFSESYDDTSYDDSADTSGDQYYEAPAEEPVTDPCMDEPAPVEEPAPAEEPAYSQDVTQAAPDETTDTETGTESDYSGTESDYSGTETAGTESDYSEPETTYTDSGETQTSDSQADPTDAPTYEQQVEQTDQAVDDYQSETDVTQSALGGGESAAGDELSGETPDYSAWAPDLSAEQDSPDLWAQLPVSAAALCCCDVSGPAAGDDLLVAPIAAGPIETPADATAVAAASGPGADGGTWVTVGGQGLGNPVEFAGVDTGGWLNDVNGEGSGNPGFAGVDTGGWLNGMPVNSSNNNPSWGGTESFWNGMNLGPAPVDNPPGNSAITLGLLGFYANPLRHARWWQTSLTKDSTLTDGHARPVRGRTVGRGCRGTCARFAIKGRSAHREDRCHAPRHGSK